MSMEAIKQFVVADRASKGATEDGFKALRQEALGFQQSEKKLDDWLAQCEQDESAFMEQQFGKDPNAKFKGSGKWKFRTYLPRAYYTSKKAVENAWKGNIDLKDKGKSALEKAVAKVGRVELSFDERMQKTLRALTALYEADRQGTLKYLEKWASDHN